MANGFSMASPLAKTYQSPNRRLSQMLLQPIGQPRQQRRGKTGQIADFLQSGLGAYLMSKDIGQQQAAQSAFTEGARGGDLKGAMASLEGLSGNPYAQNRLQNLLMQQVSRGQKEEERLKKLGSAKELYQFQQEHKKFPPKKLVPGTDIPYSLGVQSQRVERAQAAKPSWSQLAGVPGMQVSSTGQVQAIPQTPEQVMQSKLKTEAAQAQAEAKRAFPQAEQKAQETMQNIDALLAHPGLSGVVGAPDTLAGLAYKMFDVAPAGTKEADFTARLDQLGGQQFLQAFESLKGGGAISEAEGRKATDAMSRLTKTGQSEESYRQAGRELKEIIQTGLNRTRTTAGIGLPAAAVPQQPQTPFNGPVLPNAMPSTTTPQQPQMPATMGLPQITPSPDGTQYQDLLSSIQGAGLPPGGGVIQVQSIEQAMQLPPGTQFLTPDGRMKTR